MNKKSRTSNKRWQQYNFLVDEVCGKLSPTESIVLLAAFRHGRKEGYFRVSAMRLSRSVGLTKRTVQRTLSKLEHVGAIKTVRPQLGTTPKTYRIQIIETDSGYSMPLLRGDI